MRFTLVGLAIAIMGCVIIAGVAMAQESTPTLAELSNNVKALAGRLNDLGRKVDANRTAWETSNLRIADKVAANQRENAELRAVLTELYPPFFPQPGKGNVVINSDSLVFSSNGGGYGYSGRTPNGPLAIGYFNVDQRFVKGGVDISQTIQYVSSVDSIRVYIGSSNNPAFDTGVIAYDYRVCWGNSCTKWSVPLCYSGPTRSEIACR